MQVDDEPTGGLRLTPADARAGMLLAPLAIVLMVVARLPADRALAFAASTTMTGGIMLALAARVGVTARTADLVRPITKRAFVGTHPDDGGGSYRQAPRRALVIVDGVELAGPVRVEVRRDRTARGAAGHKVYLVGARQLVPVDDPVDAGAARALAQRLEVALGLAPSPDDVEREFWLREDAPATMWLLLGVACGYLGLAIALSHFIFGHHERLAAREPLAPLALVCFGAASYAWSRVGAAAARARLVAEFRLRP